MGCKPAVARGHKIPFNDVEKAIISIKDINQRFKSACEYSHTMAYIISMLNDRAFKLVNGSCGEECCEYTSELIQFWSELFDASQDYENKLEQKIKDNVIRCYDCTGDFGFDEWPAI